MEKFCWFSVLSASGHVTFVCLPHVSCLVREVLTALFLSLMLYDAG